MRHLQTIVTFVVLLTSLATFAQKDPSILQPGNSNVTMTFNGQPVDPAQVNQYNIDSQPYNKLLMTSEFTERVQPTIDKSDMPHSDPSFFSRLRQEINKVEMEEAQKNQGEGTAHVLRHVKANFAPDSITFAIAGGLVYFTQLQLVTKSDPALMVKHIESLKDPIAHISFGAFMVANGIYIDMKTRGLDPMTKQLAMKTLTYKGLAVGSFASSLTADLLVTMKECTKSWLANKNDAQSHAACDYSYKQWTVRNKFVQYAPQILSLLAAQKASEVVEGAARVGGRFLKPGVKALESMTVKFFRLSAANVDLLFVGGGWTVKAVRWIGKLTKFTMFLAVDHYVSPHVTRIGNDLIQPAFFDFDALAINKYMYRGMKHNWDAKKARDADEQFDKLPKEIYNFTERMAAWRMHLNAKAEADLQGWLEVTSKLLHQVDYAKNFYLKYIENLYDTLNRQHLVNQGEFKDAPDRAWALERRYPFRNLPLYGVKSGHDYGDVPENDIYLTKPFDIEPYQNQMVKKVAISFYPAIGVSFGLRGKHLEEMKALVKPLMGNLTPYQQGVIIEKINKRYKDTPPPPHMGRGDYIPEDTNKPIRMALWSFKQALGDPRPQLKEGSGFNMAFDTYIANYQEAKEADFDLKDQNYKFAKASDLMLYQMICGDQLATIKEGTFSGMNFLAPRIVNYSGNLKFCKDTWIFKNVKSDDAATWKESLHDWKIELDGKTYENPTRFIMSRMYSGLLGNWKDIDKADKGQGFDRWWVQSILPSLQNQLKKLDTRYGKVVEAADRQINDHKSFVDWAIDGLFNGSYYLDKNVGDNLRFEFEVYYSVLKTVLLNEKSKSKKWEYLLDVHERSIDRRHEIPYVSSTGTAQQLKNRYKWLFNFMKDVKPEEVVNLDEFSEKLLLPAREKIKLVRETQLKTPQQWIKNAKLLKNVLMLEASLNNLTKELNIIRMQEFEMNFKNFMALLARPSLKFDEMIAAKEKLYKSNTIILGGFKQMAELVGAENLPSEVQTVLAVANGLEALEIEVNRFLLMKVKLADRLEIDMSQLNTFLKHRSLAPPPKQGAAKPHGS